LLFIEPHPATLEIGDHPQPEIGTLCAIAHPMTQNILLAIQADTQHVIHGCIHDFPQLTAKELVPLTKSSDIEAGTDLFQSSGHMLRNELQQALFAHGTHEVEIHPSGTWLLTC
jgi:hypothetical protein